MVDVGWSCPRCEVVLAPHVSEHRCAPPSAGVPTTVPQPTPFQPTSVSVIHPGTVTTTFAHHDAITATTGHLGVIGPHLSEVYPARLEIHGGTSA